MQREGSCECGISTSTEAIRVIGPIGPIAQGLDYPEPRTVSHATDFINVHTFGGRGSPSF